MHHINPETVARPAAPYSQAVLVDTPARMLFVSGQIGADAQGRIAKEPELQIQLAWENLLAILAEAGMGIESIVKINILLTDTGLLETSSRIRFGFLGNARPASTVAIVSALVHPDLCFELEAVAVKSISSAKASN